MSTFEFVFSLFGLLLGLSLAEVLHGFGKALKARARVRIGWLTPLLGLIVMLDLTSFWTTAWTAREQITVNYLTLMMLLVFTGLYYLAATLIFPENPDNAPDFDAHYWANKRFVLGAVILLNVPELAFDWWTGSIAVDGWGRWLILITFFGSLIAAWTLRNARASAALLVLLVSLYPLQSALAVLGFT